MDSGYEFMIRKVSEFDLKNSGAFWRQLNQLEPNCYQKHQNGRRCTTSFVGKPWSVLLKFCF